MSGNPISRRNALIAGVAGLAAVPLSAGLAQAEDFSINAPKIYIDPGHGGSDSGAVGNGLLEKNVTLNISRRIRDILRNQGYSVRMSRNSDVYRSLSWRANDANAWGANLFVSVHINAGGGTGFESYRYTSTSARTVRFHNRVHAATVNGMRSHSYVRDRGQKTANFAVLRLTHMPAVLTENLFIDTLADANKLKQAAFKQATARGTAQGIMNHINWGQ